MEVFKGKLLLELEYNATFRPIDLGINSDARVLAVLFIEITVVCSASEEVLGHFDFRGQLPSGVHSIYGISWPEPDGHWSDGPRTAILLSLNKRPSSGIKIKINHAVVEGTTAHLFVNKSEKHSIEFNGGVSVINFNQNNSTLTDNSKQNVSCAVDKSPLVSVVIVNHKRTELVCASLLAVLASSISVPYEVIIVDNGSNSDSARMLAEMELPTLCYLASRKAIFRHLEQFRRGSRPRRVSSDVKQ